MAADIVCFSLAFFQEFLSGGKIYYHGNLFCYANFSTVFGPNFKRGQKSLEGGEKTA